MGAQRQRRLGGVLGASLDLDFLSGTLDGRISFTRASTGYYFDASGQLVSASTNVPRFGYGPFPIGHTNWIRNSQAVGASSAGGGTQATNWTVEGFGTPASGITSTIVAVGTLSDGAVYQDIRFAGTPSGTGAVNLYTEAASIIPALEGQTWTYQARLAVLATGTGLTNTAVALGHINTNGSSNPIGSSLSLTATPTDYSYSAAATAGTTAIRPRIRIAITSGQAIDITLRVAAPMLDKAASASTYVPTTGSATTVGVPTTNWLRNSTMQGAAAGTPGTLPTNWGTATISGITRAVTGVGTENGIPYIELTYTGSNTAGSTQIITLNTDGSTIIPALNGQAWTFSQYVRLVSGSLAGITAQQVISPRDSSGTGLGDVGFTLSPAPTSAGLDTQRYTLSTTLSNAATAFVVGKAMSFSVPNGVATNFVIRIGAPQLEKALSASAFIPTSGSAVTLGATPIGLLIEETRTNSIRNPRAEGATAGTINSGAVLPTNWTVALSAAHAGSTIVGTGIETGIPYIDIRIVASGTGQSLIGFDTSAATASSGQTWTESAYVRMIAGGTTGFGSVKMHMRGQDSGATELEAFLSGIAIPSTAPLATQRFSVTGTFANASTVAARGLLEFNTNGVADITIRIGIPQLEQGAFVTSPIMPPAASPAATTRAVESASLSWPSINLSGLSVAAEALLNQTTPSGTAQGFAVLDDGTSNNRISFRNSSGNNVQVVAVAGGVAGAGVGPATAWTTGASFKAAYSFTGGSSVVSLNGAAPFSGATSVPGALSTLRVGANTSGPGGCLNGYMRRIRYWPRVLSAGELQSVTA